MPKSKNRKDHKKRVQARNQRISQEKRMLEKKQREMIMQLIEQEKQKGMFENLPQINPTPQINIDGPKLDLSSGPTI
jgi:hypothetical protein